VRREEEEKNVHFKEESRRESYLGRANAHIESSDRGRLSDQRRTSGKVRENCSRKEEGQVSETGGRVVLDKNFSELRP